MPFTNQTEEKQIERAVLVGLSCPSFNTDQDADERTMDELRALAETAGAEAVAMTLQRRPAPDARTFIGEGKAEEVRQLVQQTVKVYLVVDVVFIGLAFDDIFHGFVPSFPYPLSPSWETSLGLVVRSL